MIDSKDLGTVDGFDIVVELWPDYDTRPSDYDDENYNDEQRKAYELGEWCFVGLKVCASLRGFALGSAWLWGLEYGYMPGWNVGDRGQFLDPLVYMADDWQDLADDWQDLVDEAVEDANREYTALVGDRYNKTEV